MSYSCGHCTLLGQDGHLGWGWGLLSLQLASSHAYFGMSSDASSVPSVWQYPPFAPKDTESEHTPSLRFVV